MSDARAELDALDDDCTMADLEALSPAACDELDRRLRAALADFFGSFQ